MKLNDLIKKVEKKYPLNLAYDWDNVGLLVGDFDSEVKKILVTLEANEKVIDEAIEKNVDLIVTHHPFIFRKMNKINTKDLKGRLIHKLIKNDISLYSMHTNFDIAFDGLNDYFMEVMGFEDSKILDVTNREILYKIAVYVPETHELQVRKALGESGAGYIGNYSHCTFNIQGIGTFKPEENANPFIGEIGEIEEVKEVKIETIVPQKILQKTIDNMIKSHPYEEVAYDIYKLEKLAVNIQKASICGLGQSAPNPVISTLKYFREEFRQHAIEKECKTLECKALSKIMIDPEKCKGCGLCQKHCSVRAIEGEARDKRVINQDKCIKCGTCLTNCPFHAIGN